MSDFSDRPLVAGSVVGIRSFEVDNIGRLHGVTNKAIFRPGENVASCHGVKHEWGCREVPQADFATYGIRTRRSPCGKPDCRRCAVSKQVVESIEAGHQTAGLKCTCGFYAYTDTKANPYHQGLSNVYGVIEGYGTVTVGSRGFRAEKARLVALVMPKVSRVPMSKAQVFSAVLLAVALPLNILQVASNGDSGMRVFFTLMTCLLIGSNAFTWVINREVERVSKEHVPYDKIRAAYPDVPVYSSTKQALRAHPLSAAPDPSPADPNFWDQEVSA